MRASLPFHRTIPVGAVVVAILVAACGSTPATASPRPSAAPAATSGSSAAPGSSADATPNLGVHGHDAPDLEALLPPSFASQPLERDSLSGTNALGNGSSNPMISAWLTAHGRSVDDFSVAQANDPTGSTDVTFIVFRVNGASGQDLLQAVLQSTAQYDPEMAVTQATVGGHKVTKATTDLRTRYLWTKNDMVFGVSSTHPELADQALIAAY